MCASAADPASSSVAGVEEGEEGCRHGYYCCGVCGVSGGVEGVVSEHYLRECGDVWGCVDVCLVRAFDAAVEV